MPARNGWTVPVDADPSADAVRTTRTTDPVAHSATNADVPVERSEVIAYDGDAADGGVLVEDRDRRRHSLTRLAALAVAIGESPRLASTNKRQPVTRSRVTEVIALVHRDQEIVRAGHIRKPDGCADPTREDGEIRCRRYGP